MAIKSLDELIDRFASISAYAMEFGTAEQISKLPKGDKGRVGDAMYLLANNAQHRELLELAFCDKGQPVVLLGDVLAQTLSSIPEDRTRSLVSMYAGQAIGGRHGPGALRKVLELRDPKTGCIADYMMPILDCISMIPQNGNHWQGECVDLALDLQGDRFEAYMNLLKAFQMKKPADLQFTAYKITSALYTTKFDQSTLAKVIDKVSKIVMTEQGLRHYSDVLAKAIETGKPERVQYLYNIINNFESAQNSQQALGFYGDGVRHLVDSFIACENDESAGKLAAATTDLLMSGLRTTRVLWDLSELMHNRNLGSFFIERRENLTEDERADRTERSMRQLIALNNCNLPDEVYTAYRAKGGKKLGLEFFCQTATRSEVVEAFTYLAQKTAPEYARQALANALVHGNQELAVQTATTFTKLAKIGAPSNVYKRLDTERMTETKEMIEGMTAIGSYDVINTLKLYRGHRFRSLAGVFVNSLFHNPGMAEGWCNTLQKTYFNHRDQILQMTPEQVHSIKDYFGVLIQRKKEYYPSSAISWAEFQGTVNKWLQQKPIKGQEIQS